MFQSIAMNGGDGIYSYTKNSTPQRNVANVVKDLIKKVVIDNLDVEKLLSGSGSGSDSGSSTFVIADLGCSTGPNTFHAVHTLIESVQNKNSGKKNLEFQVLFNDRIGNDFNTLFASLPQPRNYLAAAVPGSFNGRLFPSSSVHLAYSIHWLSKVPEAVMARESPAWNAGRIHYTDASDAVVRAYEDQLEEDMEAFFKARGEEIARGGVMLILLPCVPRRGVQHRACISFAFVEAILMEMVEEGVLEQEKVDLFNFPIMFPCVKGVESVVEKNGCFEVVKMEMVDGPPIDPETTVMKIRAGLEGIISHHFGKEIFEQFFVRAMPKKHYITQISTSFQSGVTDLLFAVFKRK